MPISNAFNMDCMEGMAQYPDKYFELAIVDPPYGINHSQIAAKQSNTKYGKAAAAKGIYDYKDWDRSSPDINYFNDLLRISKNQIIWGANHFISKIPFDSSCWIVWDKDNGNNGFADCELAWTSFESAVRKYKYTWNGMIQGDMKNKENRIHPTQKPIKLYKWLLTNYAKAGDKILDTHLGSGSSRIAAYDMGFDFVGYELDKDYYLAQEKRFNDFKQQLKLF